MDICKPASAIVVSSHSLENPCCYRCATAWQKMSVFIVCPECGNKRCPKATYHKNECTDSNDVGQPGSRFTTVGDVGELIPQ